MQVMHVIGDVTGLGYALANIVIFVVVHPLITFLFIWRWRREKMLRRKLEQGDLFLL